MQLVSTLESTEHGAARKARALPLLVAHDDFQAVGGCVLAPWHGGGGAHERSSQLWKAFHLGQVDHTCPRLQPRLARFC